MFFGIDRRFLLLADGPGKPDHTDRLFFAATIGAGDAADPISPVSSPLNPAGPKNFDRTEFVQLVPRDVIRPVYSPEYRAARQVGLDSEDLVIGVSINGEHRAYPIKTLAFSEMVNDVLGTSPILVSW